MEEEDLISDQELEEISKSNLDERVSHRVLFDILIQAGRVVKLHIPRDKETDKPKGFTFAEYETEEIADDAVRLFTRLVTLYNHLWTRHGDSKLANSFQIKAPLICYKHYHTMSWYAHGPKFLPICLAKFE